MRRLPNLIPSALAALAALLIADASAAGVRLIERPGQTTAVRAVVQIDGTIRTHDLGGKTKENPLQATARFGFLETRLRDAALSGGAVSASEAIQDASQLRAVRNYIEAEAEITVAGQRTTTALPEDSRRIVVEGRAEGPIKFAPDTLLMREAVDLLDMPGDPLALAALLPDPAREYEVGDSWTPPDWAAQMLCSIDAAATSELQCTLKAVADGRATIEVSGRVEGARLGAYSKINLAGLMALDLDAQLIDSASFNYSESAEIGTITPGVLSTTSVRLARKASAKTVDTDGVPVTVPPEALRLFFDAGLWNVRFQHGRDWHVYFAQLDRDPKVIILRRLDGGNLQCQCNLASIPAAAAGSHTPLDEFERDIRSTLGSRFEQIVSRDEIPGEGGVRIFRTEVQGQFADEAAEPGQTEGRAMTWTYFLIAAPDGRQLSAIFAYEPDAAAKLGEEDIAMVRSIEFFPVAAAGTQSTRR